VTSPVTLALVGNAGVLLERNARIIDDAGDSIPSILADAFNHRDRDITACFGGADEPSSPFGLVRVLTVADRVCLWLMDGCWDGPRRSKPDQMGPY
jgi:hypothetical protein